MVEEGRERGKRFFHCEEGRKRAPDKWLDFDEGEGGREEEVCLPLVAAGRRLVHSDNKWIGPFFSGT